MAATIPPSRKRTARWSTISRPIDPKVPTNLAILVVSLLGLIAGLATTLVNGQSVAASLLVGIQWAAALLLGWALGRETDPDRNASAFLAAAGSLASAILLGPPDVIFVIWFLFALRYINRSTGFPPGVLDFAALYGINLWLGFTEHWTVPLLTFPTVLFADLQRFPRWARVCLPLAMPAAAIGIGIGRGWHFEIPKWGWLELLGLAIVAISMVPVIVSYRTVRSRGDRDERPLKPHRVQWALGWLVAATVILTLVGAASFAEIGAIWPAMAGAFLGWLLEKIQTVRRAWSRR